VSAGVPSDCIERICSASMRYSTTWGKRNKSLKDKVKEQQLCKLLFQELRSNRHQGVTSTDEVQGKQLTG
jgi:hypothetical protein